MLVMLIEQGRDVLLRNKQYQNNLKNRMALIFKCYYGRIADMFLKVSSKINHCHLAITRAQKQLEATKFNSIIVGGTMEKKLVYLVSFH
uniref:Uncharacterized protein n=1 Tax=Rhizophora mucronata TaxID=61149 RepID=A0A2P2N3T2_RHIMU